VGVGDEVSACVCVLGEYGGRRGQKRSCSPVLCACGRASSLDVAQRVHERDRARLREQLHDRLPPACRSAGRPRVRGEWLVFDR